MTMKVRKSRCETDRRRFTWVEGGSSELRAPTARAGTHVTAPTAGCMQGQTQAGAERRAE